MLYHSLHTTAMMAVIPVSSNAVECISANTNGVRCGSSSGAWVQSSPCPLDTSWDSWSGDSLCSCGSSSGLQFQSCPSPIGLPPELWGHSSIGVYMLGWLSRALMGGCPSTSFIVNIHCCWWIVGFSEW